MPTLDHTLFKKNQLIYSICLGANRVSLLKLWFGAVWWQAGCWATCRKKTVRITGKLTTKQNKNFLWTYLNRSLQKGLQSIEPNFKKTKKNILCLVFSVANEKNHGCLLTEHERPYSVSITMKFLEWTKYFFAFHSSPFCMEQNTFFFFFLNGTWFIYLIQMMIIV